jgi:hypothetical protein
LLVKANKGATIGELLGKGYDTYCRFCVALWKPGESGKCCRLQLVADLSTGLPISEVGRRAVRPPVVPSRVARRPYASRGVSKPVTQKRAERGCLGCGSHGPFASPNARLCDPCVDTGLVCKKCGRGFDVRTSRLLCPECARARRILVDSRIVAKQLGVTPESTTICPRCGGEKYPRSVYCRSCYSLDGDEG